MNEPVFINSGHIHYLATEAHKRTATAENERLPNQPDALVAIVFACTSLEGLINELTELAAQPPNPPSITDFSVIGREIEKTRGSISLKYQLASKIFKGQTYDEGAPPFQDFKLLLSIRNDLVHLKPKKEITFQADGIEQTLSKSIEDLRSKNVLAQFEDPKAIASWVSFLSTQATARWACNCAADMAQSLLSMIPESSLKEKADVLYRYSFKAI